jgi:uncharacterized protein GlcG (DUF336 family)
MALTLDTAQKMIAAARAKGSEMGFNPLTVAVLDAGGHLVALAREDNSSTLRPDIAIGKAKGAISMGIGSRALGARAEQQAYFVQSINALSNGSLVPVPGGVLVKEDGKIIGAVGVTGDNSDNDEIAAIAGIEAVGLVADGG